MDIGSLIRSMLNAYHKWDDECQEKYERFQNKSDEDLERIIKGEGGFFSDTSFSAKMAAAKILRERGIF